MENKIKQKITPCLWFDKQAEEAADFYASIFDNTSVKEISRNVMDTPGGKKGEVLTVEFEIENCSFVGLNGGAYFKPNPSISFFVYCETREEVDALWQKLSKEGKALMPLDEYPFSKRYGWIEDKYGVSWQLILSDPEGDWRPKIIPCLLFVGDNCGNAEEAMEYYTSVFTNANVGNNVNHYPSGMDPEKEGNIMYADFSIGEQWFAVMDSAQEHNFQFSEGISFQVDCEDQEEVDYFWKEMTSNGGEESMCGWLKDRFGLSWQIIPSILPRLLKEEDSSRARKAFEAMLKMKKIEIGALGNP